jgi:hypothetical protein
MAPDAGRSAQLIWFKLFAREWLGRFIGISLAAQGALIRLFCASWERRDVLTDSEACRRVAGADKHEWRRIWAAVESHLEDRGGVLVSPWLEELREEAMAFREAKSQAGLAGNRARWGDRSASPPKKPAQLGRSPEPVKRRDSAARQRVFEHWKKAWNHPGAKLDAKRSRVIDEALQGGYPEADLCRSIDGYKLSPHHCGQNEKRTRYDDIELFLRDSKHIEAGLDFALGAVNGKPPLDPMTEEARQFLEDRTARIHAEGKSLEEIFPRMPEQVKRIGWTEIITAKFEQLNLEKKLGQQRTQH